MSMVLAMVLAAAMAATNGTSVANGRAATNGTAKITSASTYYDRKNGFAVFDGKVAVADGDYRIHADRAFVFMQGTNELNRVVALGHVAMTNGTRTASGDKAIYYRGPGMVVLSSTGERPAEVRDRAQGGDQVLRGSKIRFWTGLQQVEVLEAEISAPSGSVSRRGLGDAIRRR